MAPPRHGKTELVSRRFPAWYIGRHPEREFISASYGAELSTDFGRDVRNLVASLEYHRLFPGVHLAEDSQAKDRWHISGGGSYLAAGIGTSITGRGAHVLSIDDPVKDRISAESEVTRKTVWDWYRAVAYPRLQPGGAVVLTLTRWHEDDLAGQLIAQESEGGDQWEKLVLPAIDLDGHALWEEAYPRPVLDQIHRTIGEYDWSALYLQEPRPLGGGYFKAERLLVEVEREGETALEPVELLWPVDLVYAVIDTAAKAGRANDGLAVTYFGLCEYGRIAVPLQVLDWDYTQIEGAELEVWLPGIFDRLEELARETHAIMGSGGAWIEDKAAGIVLLQQARNHGWPVHPIESKLTELGKVGRAINASRYVTSRKVKFTRFAYEKTVKFKKITKNHQWAQVMGFSPSVKENEQDDLLDTFAYGVAIGLGNAEGF